MPEMLWGGCVIWDGAGDVSSGRTLIPPRGRQRDLTSHPGGAPTGASSPWPSHMERPHVVCFPFSVPSRFLWFPPPQPGHCLTVTVVPWHCLQNFWDPHPSLVPQAWRPIAFLHRSSPRLLMPSTKTLPWGPSCPPKWHLSLKGHRNLFFFLEAGEALVPSKAGEGECIPENQLG